MHTLRSLPIHRINIGQSVQISLEKEEETSREYSHLFQLYNWGHKNIQLSLDVT